MHLKFMEMSKTNNNNLANSNSYFSLDEKRSIFVVVVVFSSKVNGMRWREVSK